MAREDLLPQLIRTLMQKEGPPEESDNTILLKMVVASEKATLLDTVTVSKANSAWGSWTWGGNTWG